MQVIVQYEEIVSKIRKLLKSLVVLPVLLLLSGWAVAAEWKALRDRPETITIQGQAVALVIRSEIMTADIAQGGIRLDLRSRAALDDLQDKGPAIFTALAAAKSSCSTRWSFPRVDRPAIADGKLIVSGEVRVQKWICDRWLGDHELLSQSATFVLSATPVIADNRATLSVTAEQLDLGGLLGELGVDGELRGVLQGALGKAMSADAAGISFPAEVAPLDPRIVSLAILPTGGGRGELVIEATATMAGAQDLMQVLELLDK